MSLNLPSDLDVVFHSYSQRLGLLAAVAALFAGWASSLGLTWFGIVEEGLSILDRVSLREEFISW